MSKKIIFRNKLFEMRKKNGNIQKDIAEILQIPSSTYGGYERGERDIPLKMLVKFAELYDISIDELLFKKLPERYIEVSADEKELILKYRKLNEYDKKTMHILVSRFSSQTEPIHQIQSLKMASRDTEDSSQNNSNLSSKHIQDFEDAEDFSDD